MGEEKKGDEAFWPKQLAKLLFTWGKAKEKNQEKNHINSALLGQFEKRIKRRGSKKRKGVDIRRFDGGSRRNEKLTHDLQISISFFQDFTWPSWALHYTIKMTL